MSLYAYNKTTAALPVPTVSPIATLPLATAAPVPGASGAAFDVTGELRPDITVDPVNGIAGGLTAAQFTAIQLLVTANELWLEWTGLPEYYTPGLVVAQKATAINAVTGDDVFYIDDVSGDDSKSGRAGDPFQSIAGFYAKAPAIYLNDAHPLVNLAPNRTGTTATVISGAPSGLVRIGGLVGVRPNDVGKSIQLAKAATSANNNTFSIMAYVDPNTVDVRGNVGSQPSPGDANNGAIVWDIAYAASALYMLGGSRLIAGIRWRGPATMSAFPAKTGPSTAALDVAPVTELSLNNAAGVSIPCRTQLNFTTAAPGWTADDFSGRAFVRITRAGSMQYFELPIARNTTNTITLDTLLYDESGISASIDNAGVVTGLTGMTAAMVGNKFVLAGAATAGNNGGLTITAYNSPTSVTVSGAGGVTDANNGSLRWWSLPIDRILATDTVEIVRPAARLTGFQPATSVTSLFLGGNASSNTSTTTPNPTYGHGFEKISFMGSQISSHAVIDRAFDRCILGGVSWFNGQFSYNNVAGWKGGFNSNCPTNPPLVGGCRNEGIYTTFTTGITSGAATATLTNPAGWPASGKVKIDNEISTYTLAGSVLTFVSRGVDGTSAAAHTPLAIVYPLTAPVNPAPQVMASWWQPQGWANLQGLPTRPFGTGMLGVHRPLGLWQSSQSDNTVPAATVGAITLASPGYLAQSVGAAVMGDLIATAVNQPFLRMRLGAQALLDPHLFFGVGNGTGKDLQLETGSPINLGSGAGQFMEANGINGKFMNIESVLKLSMTQAAADSINITTATGGGPPLKSLKALRVTAAAATFAGTYILTDAAGTMIKAGDNTAVGIAQISDDGKTITFPAGTQATAITLEYTPTTPVGDCSRIAASQN